MQTTLLHPAIVSVRVTFVLRSAEVFAVFLRFVLPFSYIIMVFVLRALPQSDRCLQTEVYGRSVPRLSGNETLVARRRRPRGLRGLTPNLEGHALFLLAKSTNADTRAPANKLFASGHTATNTPDLFRTPKLTVAGPGQYWGGGPPGKPLGCC